MEEKIKCHLCEGNEILKFEELKLDSGKIIIRDSPYYKCTKCKEEFVTSKQMKELSSQINNNFSFSRPVIKT